MFLTQVTTVSRNSHLTENFWLPSGASSGTGEFIYPSWLDIDDSGNLNVSDPHNRRLQTLGPDGKDLRTTKFADLEIGNIFL